MLFFGHARIFPVVIYLAGKLRTLRACCITLLVDRAIVQRADVDAEILQIKRFALNGETALTVLF